MNYLIHHLDMYGNTVLNRKNDIQKYIKLLAETGRLVSYRTTKTKVDKGEDGLSVRTESCYILTLLNGKNRNSFEFKSEGEL